MPARQGTCGACGESRPVVGRGLCRRCYGKPTLRDKRPRVIGWSRWTPARLSALAARLRAGWSWGEMAESFGVTPAAVRWAARRRLKDNRSRYVPVRDGKGLFI